MHGFAFEESLLAVRRRDYQKRRDNRQPGEPT